MSRGTHTAEAWAEARRVFESAGLAAAVLATAIPKGTVSSRAAREGWSTPSPAEATAEERRTLDQRRRDLADALMGDCERLRELLWKPATVHHWGTESERDRNVVTTRTVFCEHEIPQPTYADQQKIMTAVAIGVDKVQLLTGEATARTETTTADLRSRVAEINEATRQRLRVVDGGVRD